MVCRHLAGAMGFTDRKAGAFGIAAHFAERLVYQSDCTGAAGRKCVEFCRILGLNPMAEKIVSMLAQAAVPAALFALGLSLARFGLMGSGLAAGVLMLLKLAVMPAIAAVFAFTVFDLTAVQAGIVVLFAALPTGANAYIFAERQGAAEAALSASVAAGTALSVVTLSIVLALVPHI